MITVGGKRGRHPTVGRTLVTVNDREVLHTAIDMVVTWIYRKAWDGKLLGDQLDDIGFDRLKKDVIGAISPEFVVSGPESTHIPERRDL